jgi:ATP-dependent RNA helicase SUPV3L1/SUV3
MSSESQATGSSSNHIALAALDHETGGAFTAPTSGERAARVREWLAGNPTPERMQEVFKELSQRDKGAARPLKGRLDELKRAKGQDHLAAEWATKAQELLEQPRLNIADAMAWQRDAAKAGAPLSKEPLSVIKTQLAERVKAIEDLQHRAFVARESAVLMAQRIELLSTKSMAEAAGAQTVLSADIDQWAAQTLALLDDAQWPSVDPKFAPQLEASRSQLVMVWEAFEAALVQGQAALADAHAPLPAVPVWAESIRAQRGQAAQEAEGAKDAKPKRDNAELKEKRQQATQIVREQLQKLEQELQEGHGKASAAAANALRHALKDQGQWLDDKTHAAANSALAAAGELEGWQRWRADQIREELLAKAQALVAKPLGGRKQQEQVRELREAWKQTDAGGHPNHGLWRKFDAACTEAHKVVEAWLEKVKEQSEAARAQRLALIDEVKTWHDANSAATEYKRMARELHAYSERWREGGHMSEKAFSEVQPLWKAAISAAHAGLDAAQAGSRERRSQMIDAAKELGAQSQLNISAIKALQQRWQQEAQTVPLERKLEQKLWDAFRAPIDEAFNRKTQAREQEAQAASQHDKAVLEAAKAVEQANASGDAQQIRAALAALEAAMRGQAAAQAENTVSAANFGAKKPDADVNTTSNAIENVADASTSPSADAPAADGHEPAPSQAQAATDAPDAPDAGQSAEPAPATPAAAPAKPAKPVIAVRGDDRPGAKKTEPAPAGRFGDRGGDRGKFGDKRGPGSPAGARRDDRGSERRPESRGPAGPGSSGFGERRFDGRAPRDFDARGPRDFEARGPRLGDAAFRAQREAQEHAQAALKKLAAQAHGEVLVNLLGAWAERDAAQLPAAKDLGRAVTPAMRTSWAAALAKPADGKADNAQTTLLRLEMAAETPTPAEFLSARRMLQLQLLTQRNAPSPKETWGADLAQVLQSPHDETSARRVQNVLKNLLRS